MYLVIAKNKKDFLNNFSNNTLDYKILYTDANNNSFENIKVKEKNVTITRIAPEGRYYNNIIDKIWYKIIKRK